MTSRNQFSLMANKILFSLISIFPSAVYADSFVRVDLAPDIPYQACFQDAAFKYSLDPFLLAAIASQESEFNRNAKHTNDDGSEDVGLMQINSRWFSELKSRGITRDVLLREPCVNVAVGAWVLAVNFYQKGVTWDSVGAYNAGGKATFTQALKRYKYSEQIYARYQDLRRNHSIDTVTVTARQNQTQDKYAELLAQTFN